MACLRRAQGRRRRERHRRGCGHRPRARVPAGAAPACAHACCTRCGRCGRCRPAADRGANQAERARRAGGGVPAPAAAPGRGGAHPRLEEEPSLLHAGARSEEGGALVAMGGGLRHLRFGHLPSGHLIEMRTMAAVEAVGGVVSVAAAAARPGRRLVEGHKAAGPGPGWGPPLAHVPAAEEHLQEAPAGGGESGGGGEAAAVAGRRGSGVVGVQGIGRREAGAPGGRPRGRSRGR